MPLKCKKCHKAHVASFDCQATAVEQIPVSQPTSQGQPSGQTGIAPWPYRIVEERLKAANGFTIADMRYVGCSDATRTLLAAAPEMYEALREAVEWSDKAKMQMFTEPAWVAGARALLNSIEGSR